MATVEELRKHCDNLYVECYEQLISELNHWLTSSFLDAHRPWKAVTENRRCRAVHIPLAIFNKNPLCMHDSRDTFSIILLVKALKNLGFFVTTLECEIFISVPRIELEMKLPLTFAQEWVQKINCSYSAYCNEEYKKAKVIYSEIISLLMAEPKENIEIYENYIYFPNFEFPNQKISYQCSNFVKRFMKRDGIEAVVKCNSYKGIKVLQQYPIN